MKLISWRFQFLLEFLSEGNKGIHFAYLWKGTEFYVKVEWFCVVLFLGNNFSHFQVYVFADIKVKVGKNVGSKRWSLNKGRSKGG